jgi:phosphoserine phosphatase
MRPTSILYSLLFLLTNLGAVNSHAQNADPLPSWRAGPAKTAIIEFVTRVSSPASGNFVPPRERIASFDNDGTLWSEQPMYFQLFFAIDRVKALAPQHPEWSSQEPFASLLKGDLKAALAGGEHAILEIVMATHTGMTTDEFEDIVNAWIATATHPQTGRLFTDMVFQPMLELLAYLRANEFKTYIVSGGGIEFMRPWVEKVYGVPPEQVIGSSVKTSYEIAEGKPVLRRQATIDFINDKAGKPVGIQTRIGRRPLAAFGNSDGDLQMLEWTMSGAGPRFALYIHHTDAEREWAYDKSSSVGRLDKGLDAAREGGWTVVDMARDWSQIYPASAR